MSDKLKVGILGATGMVGQRFNTLLDNHPWFEVTTLAASKSSAGKTYEEAVKGRWKMDTPIPEAVKNIVVKDVADVEDIAKEVDFVFSAVNMSKEEIKAIEEAYAKAETPVVSNNSAHRWTPDVPMVIPEINPEHYAVIEDQRKRLGTKKGFIAVKPNCSIQSYTPCLAAWKEFEPTKVVVSTYQAISGAGKTFKEWPEMVGNIIPLISGEEEKSEQEPLKVFGHIENGEIVKAEGPIWVLTQSIRSIGPSSLRINRSAPIIAGFTGKSSIFPTFFGHNFSERKNADVNYHFSMETAVIFCISKKMRGVLAFLSCIFISVALQYHRLTRAGAVLPAPMDDKS